MTSTAFWPLRGLLFQNHNMRTVDMPKVKKSALRDARISPGALKLKEARQYLGGLSIPTMHRLIKRGLLQPNRATRHLLFPVSELDRFLHDGVSE
jgi:Helix-turn-helix domain